MLFSRSAALLLLCDAASGIGLIRTRFTGLRRRRVTSLCASLQDEGRAQELRSRIEGKARELEELDLELKRVLANGAPQSIEGLGFESRSGVRLGDGDSDVPPSAIRLGVTNFFQQLEQILKGSKNGDEESCSPEAADFRRKVAALTLSNEGISERAKERPPIAAPLVLKVPYYALCLVLDTMFNGVPIARLWFLETVARVPYLAYVTCIHTYETLGWLRVSTTKKIVHMAEEINEGQHLLIMSYLGGDRMWLVRFAAQHAAIIYFFAMFVLWVLSPTLAYGFSELIESHAVDTYTQLAEENKELLQSMPVPPSAYKYWMAPGDTWLFDEFQTSRRKGSRRPVLNNLYDVFKTIADDEAEHVKTMRACQNPEVRLRSPNTEAAIILAAGLALGLSSMELNIDSLDQFIDIGTDELEAAATAAAATAASSSAAAASTASASASASPDAVVEGEAVAKEFLPRVVKALSDLAEVARRVL